MTLADPFYYVDFDQTKILRNVEKFRPQNAKILKVMPKKVNF